MKTQYLFFLRLLLLCIPIHFIFSFDEDSFSYNDLVPSVFTRGAKETAVHRLIGSAEVQIPNGIIMGINVIYNHFTGEATWAIPSSDSIHRNLTVPWIWEDTDGFKVNQMGHTIHGAFYFNAGRINGFNFYESVFFSVLGSSTWEIFSERNHASINDFITTVSGSLTTGEIFYRLYLEACAAGFPAPLAFFINPMAGLHRIITGWEPPNHGRNIYALNTCFGAGYVETKSSLTNSGEDLFFFRGPVADFGLTIIYGDPFTQESRIPFNHFEFNLSVGLDIGNYMGVRFTSDAYLFSFSPVYTYTDMMSTGLSLHLDAVSMGKFDWDGTSTIDQFSNALDWTIKYQRLFSQNVVFQTKFHLGFTYIGVSEYYSPEFMGDLRHYGAGFNSKLYLNLEFKKLGKLETSIFGYALWSYPGTSAVSDGTVYWLFTDIAYYHYVSNNWSIGICHSYALERGFFSKNYFPDTYKSNNVVKLLLILH